MQDPKVMLQRWPFELSSAHICEACDYLCAPGVATCPKCRTQLGEFSRPVKIDAAAAAALTAVPPIGPDPEHPYPAAGVRRAGRGALWADPTPEYAMLKSNEILTRCPHCDGILGVSVRGA